MSKNKGLTPKRKKINRNPRVKHREKFRRANIKRKGQVSTLHCGSSAFIAELAILTCVFRFGSLVPSLIFPI